MFNYQKIHNNKNKEKKKGIEQDYLLCRPSINDLSTCTCTYISRDRNKYKLASYIFKISIVGGLHFCLAILNLMKNKSAQFNLGFLRHRFSLAIWVILEI
jgi:hypothetical protein